MLHAVRSSCGFRNTENAFPFLKMYNIIIIIEIGGIATALRWSDSDTLTRIFFFSPLQIFFLFSFVWGIY